MKFIYTNFKAPEPKTYLAEKFKRKLTILTDSSNKEIIATLVSDALSFTENQKDVINTAKKEDFYAIDKRQKVLVEASKRCAIESLVKEAPLVDQEIIEEDFFTYLTAPFDDFEKYTAVLIRKTNMATMYYFFDNIQIDQGNLSFLPSDLPNEDPVVNTLKFSSDFFKGLIKKLLSSAASSVGSKIGAIVLNIVMKEMFGVEDNKELINKIRSIIKEEIQNNEIEKIDGKISGTINYLTEEYKNLKAKSDLNDRKQREVLLRNLELYSKDFYTDVLGLLEQTTYVKKGLRSYIIGVSIYILILQEKALIDPDHMNPNDTSYAITLRSNATKYLNHIETYYKELYDARSGQIYVYSDPWIDYNVHKDAYRYRDNGTNFVSQRYYDIKHSPGNWTYGKDEAEKYMKPYKSKALREFADKYADPKENIIPKLKTLKTYTFS
ncbi:hypothetical protein U8527_09875 [Kordia algicida OT-1]|uniref:Uncharacterized protein n=1 Tax=Kordia algicida OT-1 TaxID=391587 RepID=A9DVE1_9FLAO|nr:hypothetical protein [Kordia algicida]EDP96409.1 hypothetical protein KAOT1_03332 [Kordia algicida OT-1]